MLPWEARFIRGAWRGAGDSALSVGRGNGKSALVAALGCAVVDPAGPLGGRRREVIAVAASFEQSRIIFEDVWPSCPSGMTWGGKIGGGSSIRLRRRYLNTGRPERGSGA